MVWTVITDVLLVIFVLDCAFMGLVIMMQRSKQEGLGAAFGSGITDSIWGAQTSNVLVKATCWAAGIFFVLALVLARLYTSGTAHTVTPDSSIQQQLLLAPSAPTTNAISTPVTPTPAPAAATPSATAPVAPTPTAPSAATPAKATTPAAPSKPTGK